MRRATCVGEVAAVEGRREGGWAGGEAGRGRDSQNTMHARLTECVFALCVCLCAQVYNVHYSMSINGKVEEGTMEIDTANNMERFSTGSGPDEAMEVHDFQIVSPNPKFRRYDTLQSPDVSTSPLSNITMLNLL